MRVAPVRPGVLRRMCAHVVNNNAGVVDCSGVVVGPNNVKETYIAIEGDNYQKMCGLLDQVNKNLGDDQLTTGEFEELLRAADGGPVGFGRYRLAWKVSLVDGEIAVATVKALTFKEAVDAWVDALPDEVAMDLADKVYEGWREIAFNMKGTISTHNMHVVARAVVKKKADTAMQQTHIFRMFLGEVGK